MRKKTRVLSARNTWLLVITKMVACLFVCLFVRGFFVSCWCKLWGIELIKNRHLKPEDTNEVSVSSLLNLKDIFQNTSLRHVPFFKSTKLRNYFYFQNFLVCLLKYYLNHSRLGGMQFREFLYVTELLSKCLLDIKYPQRIVLYHLVWKVLLLLLSHLIYDLNFLG